jgi:hypothetical protein
MHRYAVGDSSVAETCDSFCMRCGRGHIHTARCDGNLCKSTMHDGVRHHDEGTLGGSREVDEMTHDYFWQHINFEDPVKDAAEREAFRKCGNTCGCEEHAKEVRPCMQAAWSLHCALQAR